MIPQTKELFNDYEAFLARYVFPLAPGAPMLTHANPLYIVATSTPRYGACFPSAI